MSGPEQPWWVRPGGAPPPGAPADRPPAWPPPRPTGHRPQHAAPRPAPRPPAPVLPPPQHPVRTPPRGRSRRWLIAGAAVGAVVLVAVGLTVWQLGESSGTRLDVRQAEAGVAEILSNPIHGYGANDVAAVACNNGRNPEVKVGATFTCAVDINATVRQVTVEFTDDSGTYAVDGPR